MLDYPYLKNNYRVISIGLGKQQALGADPRAIQQINFTGNLDRTQGAFIFFILEVSKETVLDFLQRTVKVL